MAIGFFDFNLLPLPENSEQPREVQVDYAVAPARRNPVLGRVRRTKSGNKPVFKLTLQPSIEWVEDGHYHQVRDLTSTYSFNSTLGIIDQATIELEAGVERDDGRHRYQIQMALDLANPPSRTRADPHRLRENVLASAEVQSLLKCDDKERSMAAAERLRAADIDLPKLRQLADSLVSSILQPSPSPTQAWWLCIAQGRQDAQDQAQALAQQLNAAGFASRLVLDQDQQLCVVVGPYPSQDPAVLAQIARDFPQFSPRWWGMP